MAERLSAAAFLGGSEFHSFLGPNLPVDPPPPQGECFGAAHCAPWRIPAPYPPTLGQRTQRRDVGKDAVRVDIRNVRNLELWHDPPPHLSTSLRNLLAAASLTHICISQPFPLNVPLGSGERPQSSIVRLVCVGRLAAMASRWG